MKNNSIKTISLSLLVMALWGSLFPFIKTGYSDFGIKGKALDYDKLFAKKEEVTGI